MRRVAFAALLCALVPRPVAAACTGSSPSWTATSDRTSVASCVSSSVSGDTVTVTGSGSVTWSPVITVTKAITLTGPGKATLTVTGGVSYQPTAGEVAKTFDLSGFTFTGTSAQFTADAPTTTTPITGLKIHDNAFTNCSVASCRAINLHGLEFGVIYSNTFSGNTISVSTSNGVGFPGETYPHDFGSVNCLYVEDNTFGNGTDSFVTETGQGGRLCFRHNTITGYSCGGCEVFDIHGDQNSGGGTILSEYVHNTLTVGVNMRWMHHRGGQAVIINNTVDRSDADFDFSEYRAWGGNGECTTYPVSFSSDVTPGNTNRCSPANDTTCIEVQIHNSFYANNLVGGSNQTPSFTHNDLTGTCGATHESQYIQQNREYWLPTSGTASAIPATCTADGNTFYNATDTDVISKCTSTNTWTAYYTPYTYPHPLRGVSSPQQPGASKTRLRIRGSATTEPGAERQDGECRGLRDRCRSRQGAGHATKRAAVRERIGELFHRERRVDATQIRVKGERADLKKQRALVRDPEPELANAAGVSISDVVESRAIDIRHVDRRIRVDAVSVDLRIVDERSDRGRAIGERHAVEIPRDRHGVGRHADQQAPKGHGDESQAHRRPPVLRDRGAYIPEWLRSTGTHLVNVLEDFC
jgi:hypothetical protein